MGKESLRVNIFQHFAKCPTCPVAEARIEEEMRSATIAGQPFEIEELTIRCSTHLRDNLRVEIVMGGEASGDLEVEGGFRVNSVKQLLYKAVDCPHKSADLSPAL